MAIYWITLLGVMSSATVNISLPPDFPATPASRIAHHLSQIAVEFPTSLSVFTDDSPPQTFSLHSFVSNTSITIEISGSSIQSQLYGIYHVLETVFGFGFFHPLQTLRVKTDIRTQAKTYLRKYSESPYWAIRGIHLNTIHSLEHVELLNGFGTYPSLDGWENQLIEWTKVLEWAVANKQTRVEWVLLYDSAWDSFSQSPLRQDRLRTLVTMAHDWQLEVGAGASLTLSQHHTFSLIRDTTRAHSELTSRLDFLFGAGFDYLSTEIAG